MDVTCTATGGAGIGDYVYVWTSNCSCPFATTSFTGITSVITRPAVHSGDIGIHTCTATRDGESASASITFNVVGEWLLLHKYVVINMPLTRRWWVLNIEVGPLLP